MLGNHTQHFDTELPNFRTVIQCLEVRKPNNVGTQRIITILFELGYAIGI